MRRISECPQGTHACLDDALGCHRCQASSRQEQDARRKARTEGYDTGYEEGVRDVASGARASRQTSADMLVLQRLETARWKSLAEALGHQVNDLTEVLEASDEYKAGQASHTSEVVATEMLLEKAGAEASRWEAAARAMARSINAAYAALNNPAASEWSYAMPITSLYDLEDE